jgi:hypothetical protein
VEQLLDLWLPILVSAVVVFVASFLAWMVLPHHTADVRKLPDEPSFTAHLKGLGLEPGTYMWPNCEDPAEMRSADYKQRYQDGPWGSMIVTNKPNFGRNLGVTFLFYIAVGIVVAYLTSEARAPGAEFLPVFQVASTVAVIAYCFGGLPHALFFGRPLRFIITETIDGLVYGLITGLIFALMWPSAAIETPAVPI